MKKCRTLFLIIFMIVQAVSFGEEALHVLSGGGATFPAPLYLSWFSDIEKDFGITIKYDAVGSGGGIEMLQERQIDFGAADLLLTGERNELSPDEILQIPATLGAVVVVYNLPGKPFLKLSADVIVAIFTGEINKWNDPLIQELNPGLLLPAMPIRVIHRSDPSGTTYLFSEFLSENSLQWEESFGTATKINWKIGMGVSGNSKVIEFLKIVPGSISYTGFNYAVENNLPMAAIGEKLTGFVSPMMTTISKAAEYAVIDNGLIHLEKKVGRDKYPISAFSYIIVFKEQNYSGRTLEISGDLMKMLQWSLTKGQEKAPLLLYAPLPQNVVLAADSLLRQIVFDGVPVMEVSRAQ
jgi:phosphate transport system substrate-binding protein